MTFDDFIYALLLIISLFLGILMKRCGNGRSYLSGLFGLLMVLATVRSFAWHSAVTVFGFLFILGVCPHSFIHYATFIWCFGYLGFFRLCHFFEFAKAPALANVVQLLLTLRLTGLSFELHDSWVVDQKLADSSKLNDSERRKLMLTKRCKNISASPFGIIAYAYCYIGLFTGPYFKYRTFYDFANWSAALPPICTDQLLQQLQETPVFGIAYLILSHFYSIDYVRLPEFHEHNFGYRFFYMIVVSAVFRLRIYFAWKAAECVCMCAGLGAYPALGECSSGEGPNNLPAYDSWMKKYSKQEDSVLNSLNHDRRFPYVPTEVANPVVRNPEAYTFTTIENISIWGCECTPTVRETIRSWNKSVQYWLATNVHKRCWFSNRIARTVWTMLVSAYWHGFHPGYYLSFLTIPLALAAESGLVELIGLCGSGLPAGSSSFFNWILKMRIFEYCTMGFLLLDAPATLSYWHSIYFCIHIILLTIVLLNFLLHKILPLSSFRAPPTVLSTSDQMARLHEQIRNRHLHS